MNDRFLRSAKLGALSLAVAGAVASACSSGAPGGTSTPAPTVAVARVTRGPLTRVDTVPSAFRPYQDVDVHAKIAGYVREIRVDVGSRVRAGQIMATLEVPELKDEVTQADAGVGAAKSEVTRATAEVTRAKSAYDVAHLEATRLLGVSKSQPGLVAQQEIDDATGRDKVDEAQVATATAALAVANQQLEVAQANQARTHALYDYTTITAPFTGVVTKRYADTGTMIQAGTASTTQALPLVRLAEVDRLRLVIPVTERDVPAIHDGGTVDVQVPDLNNKTFKGTIARSADEIDPAAFTMHVEVDVENPDGILVPGMYANASIVLQHSDNVLTVPVQALDRGETTVTVMRVGASGTLERPVVQLGLETADAAEVLSGLHEGDLVVVGSRAQLHAGQTVQPKVVSVTELAGGR